MKHEDKQGYVFAASIGAAIGVGVTAMRELEAILGPVLSLLSGAGLAAVVAVVLGLVLQHLVVRPSKPVE